jgi:O-antigen/teichoic acid export membrane protein
MNALSKKLKLDTKMGSDIFWNMVSMGFVALSGLLYNTIFILLFDPATLGVFNQANVYYLIFSQIAVFGIHFSVLKYASQYADEKEKRDKMISSAVMGTLIISFLVAAVFLFIAILINQSLNYNVVTLLYFAFPALIFFSLNKVLLNFLNGIREMKPFALFQSLRYIFIIIVLLLLGFFKVPSNYLMLVYLVSEVLLFVIMASFIGKRKLIEFSFDRTWFKEHFSFGSKIFLGNLVIDLNSKMDILVLGFFVSDYIVGIYSFAVIFAEGFYQILAVVRKNINPLITKYYIESPQELTALKKSVSRKAYKFAPIVGGLVVFGFYVLCLILDKAEYISAIVPLAIVVFSNVICSYFIIMGNTMNQTGHPKSETVINVLTIATNCILNVLFIPWFGIIGAAVATGISFFAYSIALQLFCKNKIDMDLLNFK